MVQAGSVQFTMFVWLFWCWVRSEHSEGIFWNNLCVRVCMVAVWWCSVYCRWHHLALTDWTSQAARLTASRQAGTHQDGDLTEPVLTAQVWAGQVSQDNQHTAGSNRRERERERLLEWANWGLWTIFPASCELIALFQLIKKSSRTAMAIISALSSLMRFLITLATQINVNLLEYTGGWWTSRPSLELDDIWWLKRYLSYLIKGQVM